MRPINMIIIHCADTPANMNIGAKEIDQWHKQRGWDRIGYHYVIRRDGTLETGRAEHSIGAHAKGHNRHSIGICLVGGKGDDNTPETNFTRYQYRTLDSLIGVLTAKYKTARVIGHNDVSEKACPTFDVDKYMNIFYRGKEVDR